MIDVIIKFIDGEEITIKRATKFIGLDDCWKVEVNDETNLFFNNSQVKYIGDKAFLRSDDNV